MFLKTSYLMQECLKSVWENEITLSQKLESRRVSQGVSHDFYTIISLSSLGKGFHSPREGCLSPVGASLPEAAKMELCQVLDNL